MSQRLERVAGEVRAVLGEILAREEIKDPRVRGAGLITVTNVHVSGDLRHARVMFIVHGLDAPALERVRQGLDHASGYFRSAIARRLRTKASPAVIFEVDQVFDKALRVEAILRELGPAPAAKPGEAKPGEAKPGETKPAAPAVDDEAAPDVDDEAGK